MLRFSPAPPSLIQRFRSPEQMNERKYSKKSDVYSFGVVLFEIYARQEPWPDKGALQVAKLVMDGTSLKVCLCSVGASIWDD
jgi:serine/threonine protein kinase